MTAQPVPPAQAPPVPSYPPPARAWYMVALLTIASIFSFIDKYIPALLVEPVKQDLGLTDTEVGLLLGAAFATLYAAMGLPMGWLADRYRRTWLVGSGVALWSLATAASGLARSFGQLVLARVGVGVGDSALAPCALSLIGDSFPPARRGRPIACYITAQSVGAGLAALGGAAVLSWAQARPEMSLPFIGIVRPWQFTFIAVGLPGLAVALLLALLREPARVSAERPGPSMDETLRYLAGKRGVFASFVALVCVMTIIAYSQNWYAALFVRTWHWDIAKFAVWSGIALIVIGPLTVNATGWLSDRLVARGYADGPLRIVIAGTLLIVPTGALVPLLPTGEAAFGLWLCNLVGLSLVSAAAPIALLNITPGEVRGQVAALFYMIIMLTGLVIGPLAVGLLNDGVFGESGLRYSAACVPVLVGLPGIALIPYARRAYRAELAGFHAR